MSHPLRSFVIGGAGFIGSHLVDQLVARGPVTVYDNLSVGSEDFLSAHLRVPGNEGRADAPANEGRADAPVKLVRADALELERLSAAMAGHDVVFHLAANPEARWGLQRTRLDLEQGTIATYNALEAARLTGTKRFVFASSGTVYGETPQRCAEEDLGSLPISLYGASKLAGEALISAFVECFQLRAWIFRFGNVVGPRGTHGAALDFLKKLRAERARVGVADHEPQQPSPGPELEVLGDGRQAKPYLHVSDCVAGILYGLDHAAEPLNVYNLAPPDLTDVRTIAERCIAASPVKNAVIRFTGGDRGWAGDVPRSQMSPRKLSELGFRVRYSSDQAVGLAIDDLAREVFPDATD